MRREIALLTPLMIFLFTASALAESYPDYAGRKLGRGLTNVALGWTEILKSEDKAIDEHGAVAAVFVGPLDGIGNAIKRTAVGVLETVTFPIRTSESSAPEIEPEIPAARSERAGYRPKDYIF